jgi:aminobenzoyl-glutamate utilization protein B
MGNGIEFMREHIPSNARIHYIITNGGAAPNIVPDIATLEIMARSPTLPVLDGIWKRLVKIAEGAALMTETTMEMNIQSTDANIIGNDVLAKVAQKNLEEVGGFEYTPAEIKFAQELQKTIPAELAGGLDSTSKVQPLRPVDPNAPSASTDAGDVSWNVPTIGFGAATFVPGIAAHSWQATACAGMSIGQRGMVVAAKALAITAEDLFADPKLVAAAHTEFQRQMQGKVYSTQIPPTQKPPLNYRSK